MFMNIASTSFLQDIIWLFTIIKFKVLTILNIPSGYYTPSLFTFSVTAFHNKFQFKQGMWYCHLHPHPPQKNKWANNMKGSILPFDHVIWIPDWSMRIHAILQQKKDIRFLKFRWVIEICTMYIRNVQLIPDGGGQEILERWK